MDNKQQQQKEKQAMTDLERDVAKQTVISNINAMSTTIGIKPISFRVAWAFSLEQLRTIQESLIVHYNNHHNKRGNDNG